MSTWGGWVGLPHLHKVVVVRDDITTFKCFPYIFITLKEKFVQRLKKQTKTKPFSYNQLHLPRRLLHTAWINGCSAPTERSAKHWSCLLLAAEKSAKQHLRSVKLKGLLLFAPEFQTEVCFYWGITGLKVVKCLILCNITILRGFESSANFRQRCWTMFSVHSICCSGCFILY